VGIAKVLVAPPASLPLSGGVVTGPTTFSSVVTENAGTNTAGAANITSPAPASGVAFTPSATNDSTVYFQVNAAAAGSYTLTMGPTTGAENTVASAVAMLIGSDALVTLRVPATWKVVITLTSVTLAQTRVVTS